MKARFTSLTAMALALGATGVSAQELSILIDNTPASSGAFTALTEAYTAKNPDVTFDIEVRPGGGEGDNIVKTRLATGEMTDIFSYNSGSLFQALRPSRTLVPINDIPNLDNLNESFLQTVADGDGNYYGVPYEAAMGGGILYHVPTYEELGLEVPQTWDEFMANNAAIAEQTDKAPVIQTYRDTWTSQLFVLADYYNVQSQEPGFADAYTANEAKYATTPAAQAGFARLQEVYEAGYLNEDFGAANFDDGVRMVATGEGVHYPMLTFSLANIEQNYPDLIDDVGFFAQPGESVDANGLTIWLPAAAYIPQTSENVEAAKDFLNFMASSEGCAAIVSANGATGPMLVEGCELPDSVPRAVSDMLPYFNEEGRTAPALEFLSPVKGPALEQLTVEVGSGIRDAQSAAELYDADVTKQARQLGLPNW
ncbi:extracellular solute-binding protein [Loktanella sp. SALINAS62]|uniref:ABC transporter substrate-binding protein n=1 Tax=Loktanella sp. SALINAS62 TaxID=2706124 RepID=UPI001B8D0500|nr:extracellular solute-binding protein [Loktanella sp. SALINAS62]MBS1301364.1 extracellular solute-binding protein [Loktanella sp. SALINAS62]